jgi:hypothetical protein
LYPYQPKPTNAKIDIPISNVVMRNLSDGVQSFLCLAQNALRLNGQD